MIRSLVRVAPLLAGLTFCSLPALAQDVAWVPPKGGYDTPGSFIKTLGNVGETYERTLGALQTNVYQRQVRFKLRGLEKLAALTSGEAASAPAPAPAVEESKPSGGLFGSLFGGRKRDKDAAAESSKDTVLLRLLEAGSPADGPGAVLADVMLPPDQIHGSILGVKVGNKMRVTVDSADFTPRVLIARYKPAGLMSPIQGNAEPDLVVVASTETEGMGTSKVTATYDRTINATDGSTGFFIIVTSEDGKATGGKYTIRYAPQ